MRSHEVLKQVVAVAGTKQIAHDLRVSTSLVYKWCSEPPVEAGDDRAGARNPLDRVLQLLESTGDPLLIEWLCGRAGGYFVESTAPENERVDSRYIDHTRTLLAGFSELLQVMSDSITHEGRIDAAEAADIRRQWQRLQARGEAFVRACEDGLFDPNR